MAEQRRERPRGPADRPGLPPAPTPTLKQRQTCGCDDHRHVPPKPPRDWTRAEALAVARILREKGSEVDRRLAEDVLGSTLEESRRGGCFTDVAEMLEEARSHLRSGPDSDSDSDASEADFDDVLDADGVRVQFQTTNFTIDYTTTTGAADQIQDPASDTAVNVTLANGTSIGTTIAGNGVPDFVEMLGIWLEHYLAQFVAYGFNTPIQTDAGGNPIRLLVVVRAGGSATSPGGPIGIQNTLGASAGLAGGYNASTSGLGVTPGHELFHQVQYTYNGTSSGAQPFLRIYREGTARWSEDAVNDAYNRYNVEVPGYLGNTSIDHFSVPNRYETVLYWKYLSEQVGAVATEPQRGVDSIISLWQNLATATTDAAGITATSSTIASLGGGSIEAHFADFAVANYAKDLGNPFTNADFEYLEDEEPRVPGGQVYTSVVPFDVETINGLSPDYAGAGTLGPWGLHYYVFDCQPSVQDLRVNVTADPAFTEPFFRVLEIRGTDLTVHSSAGPAYEVTITRDLTDPASAPVDQVVVIVGAYRTGGSYGVGLAVNEGVPSVMLVLDHSGSMSSQNKMAAAQAAASLFVDVAETNGVPGLGAVGFSTTAAVLPDSSLTVLNAAKALAVKDDVDDLAPTDMTSIGHGLQVAAGQFAADPVGAANEVIVLLSDGQENTVPLIADVQNGLVTAGTKVYSVGLGTDWGIDPAKLEDVATATGGDFRITADPAVLQEFYLQIVATAVDGDMDGSEAAGDDSDADAPSEGDLVALVAPGLRVATTARKPIKVVTPDRALNVVLTTTSPAAEKLDLVLVAPDGTAITEERARTDDRVAFRRGRNYVLATVQLPLAGNHAGTWHAYGVVPDQQPAQFQIKAMLKSGLRLTAGTEADTLVTGAPIGIRVRLRENGRPLAGASIRVLSDKPLTGVGNYLAQPVAHPSQGDVAGDALSARQLKLDALIAQTGEGVFQRETNQIALAAGDDGTYASDLYTATTPGSHTFTVEASGTTSAGEEFTRYVTFTKVARVAVDSAATRWDVRAPAAGRLSVTFTPADAYGNLLGPGFAPTMHVVASAGATSGAITDHNDGTYSVEVDAGTGTPAISVVVGEKAIAVPATLVDAALSGGAAPGGNKQLQNLQWLALLALVLALIALVVALSA